MYINDTYKKSLLLSAASYFEVAITKAIHDFVDRKIAAKHRNCSIC